MSVNLPSLKGILKTHKTTDKKTPKERAPIRLVNPGKYTHFGIQNYLLNLTDELVLSQDEITIDLGIDGAPLANSSALQAWPIMGYICGSNLPVFDIGVYVGTKKPKSCCVFLKEYVEEKIDLETYGVLVSPNKIRKLFKVNVISADAPARA